MIELEEVLAIHRLAITDFGGTDGLRYDIIFLQTYEKTIHQRVYITKNKQLRQSY